MSYSHMFYGVDIQQLRALYGSKDEALVTKILAAKRDELDNNDGFFEGYGNDGDDFPTSEIALRGIIRGELKTCENCEALYGHVLKIICEHIGESIGADVAAVRDHPYISQLVAAGPPIPIPYDGTDFPEIGFLALADIPAEIQRIDSAPHKAKRSLLLSLLSRLTGGIVGRQMSDEEVVEDMHAYRDVLEEAKNKKLSIVSFRH